MRQTRRPKSSTRVLSDWPDTCSINHSSGAVLSIAIPFAIPALRRSCFPIGFTAPGPSSGAIAAPQDAVGTAGDVELWARTGNATLIPAGKLANAPGGSAVDQTARNAAAAALAVAEAPDVDQTARDAAAAAQETANDGLIPDATEGTRGIVRGATSTQATAANGTTILGWANNRLRQFVNTIVPTWARANDDTPIPADKLTLAPSGPAGDPAWPWAERGNTEVIPTGKIPFEGVQNQIDEIHEQLAHAAGPRTEVVGVLGSSDSRLRYTLPADLDGLYDVSVRVRARVFVHPLVNFSGDLRIIEDGGLGLDAAIPQKTHDYGNVHEGVLIFIRKGLSVSPGINIIDFEGLVSGNNPPDVDFGEVENLVLTDASLVNANNVNPFIADWAETGDATAIPAGKLGNAPAGGLTLIAESTVRSMARTIGAADVIAGRTLGAGDFVLAQCSHVNGDGDVQASRGWNEPYLIGTKVNFDWAVEDMTAIALHATNVAGEIQVSVLGGTNPIADLYRIRVFRFAIN